MTTADELDQRAIACARPYMGEVAWPTIILGLVFPVSYVGAVVLVLTGVLPLWIAVPLVALLTYLSYTILHDSAHGSITGTQSSLRWLNKALGYMAAWIVMIPLTAHRHEHMAHHRYANDEAKDPDFHVRNIRRSPLAAVLAVGRASFCQFTYYAEKRWANAPSKEKLSLCLEVAAMLIPRLAVLFAGFWVEGLALFVLAWLLGAIVLLYLFAYVVHRPHEHVGRYLDTSTILLPGPLHTLVTWLWMFQNYHSIHHLFPRVPFYRYAKLYEDIEEIMMAKGAPIYRITASGLQQSSPSMAN